MPRPGVERSCCGCRTRREKKQLVRFVEVAPGRVELDPEGTAGGRGAYVCRSISCMELAFKRGGLARTLRTAIPGEQAAALRMRFVGYLGVIDD
ncbi:MAG TPA: YlxR family protein [Actinomycetota bacterium]|jgi:predicted RNA-binding protein YlxR (DUF448 family)|nr:YlxR family protein [Actinomycetota bacterium]